MDTLLHLAKGPLFAGTFAFMFVGLVRHVVMQSAQLATSVARLSYRRIGIRQNLKNIVRWLIPVNHLYHNRSLMSISSFLFHVGLLITPLFLADHITLIGNVIGFTWPALPAHVADGLTLIVIVAGLVLFGVRVFDLGARQLSSFVDYLLLIAVLLPFVSGFMAFHPAVNPLAYRPMLLIHMLSAELLFVLIPITKLSHCVLFLFLRFSSDVFWKMPVGAGERVARELHGEDARV